jgi:hypothetical protein
MYRIHVMFMEVPCSLLVEVRQGFTGKDLLQVALKG